MADLQTPSSAPTPFSQRSPEEREAWLASLPPALAREELSENVISLISPVTGARIYIVGTAHVSKMSAEEVRSTIRKVKPSQVLLELCSSRQALIKPVVTNIEARVQPLLNQGIPIRDAISMVRQQLDDERKQEEAKKAEPTPPPAPAAASAPAPDDEANQSWFQFIKSAFKSMKSNAASGSFLGVLLSGMYKRFSKQLSIEAGEEMKVGAQEALLQGSQVILGDRPIWITLQRTWNSMTLWQKITLIGSVAQAFVVNITPEEIEALKNGDLISELVAELTKYHPSLAAHVLEERDLYMVHTLRNCKGKVVVGVVGLAHLKGIKANWESDIDVKDLVLPLPKKSSLRKALLIFMAVLVALLALFVAWLFY